MTLTNRNALRLTCLALVTSGCGEPQPRAEQQSQSFSTCGAEARGVVEQLGKRMRLVSVLGPDSVVARELRDAYGSLVTPALLSAWEAAPATAPGREVSNPWPARIEVSSVAPGDEDCRVEGTVVYVTTADTTSAVERRTVTLRVRDRGDWRVNGYKTTVAAKTAVTAKPAVADTTTPAPADVVRRYYSAIQARDYDAAYALWGQLGKASGKTRADFAAGFSDTREVRATTGDSVRVEGAAGSQYATVPVKVDAVLRDGRRQHFEGAYTLRRSMVDGATAEQRRWRIYSADVR